MTENDLYRLFGLGENKSVFPYVRKDAFLRFYNSHRVLYRVNSDGRPVGLLTYMQYLRSSKKQIGVAYDVQLCEIVVAPEYKGVGIAKSLFEELESLARLAGARHVVLSVRKDNARACRFYEKMGMHVVSEKTWNEKGAPLPGLVYSKELASCKMQGLK